MNDLEQIDTTIQSLIIRYFDGSISDTELHDLQAWLEVSKEHIIFFNKLHESWVCSGGEQRYPADAAWDKVSNKLHGKSYRFRWHKLMSYAAVAVMALSVGAYSWHNLSKRESQLQVAEAIEPGSKRAILVLGSNERVELGNESDSIITHTCIHHRNNTLLYAESAHTQNVTEFNTLITPRGGEYSIILSDGTKVWLNSESELKYPVQFSGKERKVYLKGEAYFSVTKKEGATFVVCSGNNQISVLGTEFNVRNYESEVMAATLVRGSVVVADANNHSCRLNPGQQAIFNEGAIEVREVETILYTGWKDGFFIYRDKTLDDIMKELARWYDFTYFYQNPEAANFVLTARLKKFDRVESIFDILAETGKFKFQQKGRTVTIVAK